MRTSVVRGFRPGVVAVMVLILALAGVFTAGAGVARADTGKGQVTHVFMNIGGSPSQTQSSQYGQLIGSLRAAAGHTFRGSVFQTQSNDEGLIQLTLTLDGVTATLWITPNDLYVVGYSTNSGTPFILADTPADVADRIRAANPNNFVNSLNFGGNYNALSQAAGRGREAMPISFADVRGSALNLANAVHPYGADQQAVARSLMFMIQFTSEAARLNDVFTTMSSAMNESGQLRGLPMLEQDLENNWGRISDYAAAVNQNPAIPPVTVTGVGTLSSFADVQRYLAMALFAVALVNGDLKHDEL